MKGYKFREDGKGTWVITSDIKIVRRISKEERQKITKNKGYDEIKAYKKI